MSNKDIFKELYSKKLNKEKNYNKVLANLEEKNRIKYLKLSFVSICLVALICGVAIFNSNVLLSQDKKTNNIYVDKKNNIALNINDLSSEVSITKIDANVESVKDRINLAHYDLLDLSIPKDINEKDVYGIYPNNGNNTESNRAYNYNLVYKNVKSNRNINIGFSKENKPIRDYHFDDNGSKISRINDTELKIYRYEELYMTEFNYKGINYDIETSNISQEELILLLQSIIK